MQMTASTGTILYAEDDENDVLLTQRAFKQAGITNPLLILPDGNKTVDYLQGKGQYSDRAAFPLPRLILLDLKLPGVCGLDILKLVRATPSTSTIPVVILTSSMQDQDIHRTYLQGANAYLVKPSNPDRLLVMVQAIRDFWILQNQPPRGYVEVGINGGSPSQVANQ
jgi:CheY-like chemotaxis protein